MNTSSFARVCFLAAGLSLALGCSSTDDTNENTGSAGSSGRGGASGASGSSGSGGSSGATGSCGKPEARCPGAPMPTWKLTDFQPDSPKFGMTYGLEEFSGKVTVVALWSGWCPYCQSQAGHVQALSESLKMEGKDVAFVAVNSIDAEKNQEDLHTKCKFPLFQDTAATKAWNGVSGKKDDFYIYGADGKLRAHFTKDSPSTNLGTDEGMKNLKDAIIAAGQ